jgi:hypothetical protein
MLNWYDKGGDLKAGDWKYPVIGMIEYGFWKTMWCIFFHKGKDYLRPSNDGAAYECDKCKVTIISDLR